MTTLHDTLTETELLPEEVISEETPASFTPAPSDESEMKASPESLEEAARKQERKAEKKKLKKKSKLKEKKSSAKAQAVTFPMVELIDEQVRTSIPEELVAK